MVGVMNDGQILTTVETVICLAVFIGLMVVMAIYAVKTWRENKEL